jgi:hypothetical protein
MMSDGGTVEAWHFVGDTLRDGRPVPVDGKLLRFDGVPILCESGLHAGRVPSDALRYALGPIDLRHLQPGDPPTEINSLSGTHGLLRPHRGRCEHVDWVIVGGESGPKARPFDVSWASSIVEQCRSAGVPVFVKQLGANVSGWPPTADRKGGDQNEWPAYLRVREFPG